MKIFTYAVIAIVAISVVAGFFLVGTPQDSRIRYYDQARVNDLQNIHYQIIKYWQAKKTLPATLADLVDKNQGVLPPTDPETQEDYGYNILDETKLSFELCANFRSSNSDSISKEEIPRMNEPAFYAEPEKADWNWRHEVGRVCFERFIDPDLYKTSGQ